MMTLSVLGVIALCAFMVIAGICALTLHDTDLMRMHPPDEEAGNEGMNKKEGDYDRHCQ